MGDGSPQGANPVSLLQLKPKMELHGQITRVDLYGAFVDVGAEKEGFVHLSELRHGPVNKVGEAVQVGQGVTVWVRAVDPGNGKLELTMVKPLAYDWSELKKGMTVHGTVVRLEKFGVFVDLGAERPGLVHVSELSGNYVKDPADIVHVGDEIDVRILEVIRKKKQIQLSLKALEIKAEEGPAEPAEEPPITAMQAAFEKARETADRQGQAAPGPRTRKSNTDLKRREQEEIISRTLETSVRKP
ncbi:MAG: S1 RNA-binding domain-containing protein [Anaerolineales bacterium]|jgi:predicted RNA-binding protein with RPS1 domain